MLFLDRADAGRQLAEKLLPYRSAGPVVLGVPRGGVPVAFVAAEALDAPLDVIVVRKLGVPYQPELAMGAVGEDGVRVVNDEVVRMAGVSPHDLNVADRRERAEVVSRARRFRGSRSPEPLTGRTAILVDDGIATGSTMVAACQVVRAHGATHIVVAVPVAPPDVLSRLARVADEVVCLHTPEGFFGVGQWYDDFSQTSDAEVTTLLARARESRRAAPPARRKRSPVDVEILLPAGGERLVGHLTVPEDALGLVLFAHGSGSSRRSPRNQYVARVLNEAGLATVLLDLLTVEEERDRDNVFDVDLLAGRLAAVTRALTRDSRTAGLPVGYFGASTGAAAALVAATEPGQHIAAVVSRGGRPDLAGGERLQRVTAPTLLIVGGHDQLVLDLNRRAQGRLRCVTRLHVVPGATHLFEEPGALEEVAAQARDWFLAHLAPTPAPATPTGTGTAETGTAGTGTSGVAGTKVTRS